MNQYKKLAANSTIMAIGTFSSKVLVFLLLPLYSSVMSTSEYGIADIVAQSANLLYPLVTMGICNSVFRFSYGNKKDEKAVFTTGILTLLFGIVIYLLLVLCVLRFITVLAEYLLLLGLYVFMYGANQICSQYVRGKGLVRIYAFKGMVCTASTLIFNILLLLVFKLGVVGYLLANILADYVTVIYMFIRCKLIDDFDMSVLRKGLVRDMLNYARPLIPSTVFWWITNISDRYLVLYILGDAAEGVYAMSYKIPNLMVTLTGIFNDAWQMSLIEESKSGHMGKFFSKVFESFKSIMFVAASGLILFVKVITRILIKNAFYDSWRYMPYLIIATACSGIVTFVSVIYLVKKESKNSLICAASSAIVNVILNLIFIKPFGVFGVAAATMLSYLITYFITTYRSLKYVRYRTHIGRTLFNVLLLVIQSVIMIYEIPLHYLFSALIFCFIFAINIKRMYYSVKRIIRK